MAYLHPGVYVEEIPSGSKPIESVSTSTAVFVGQALRGLVGEPVLIHGRDDYVREFGQIVSADDAMGLAVFAYYMNGGKDAYVCRLENKTTPAETASLDLVGEDSGSDPVLKVSARSEGAWGNKVLIKIKKEEARPLNFTIQVGHSEPKRVDPFVVDEEFAGLTMQVSSPNHVLKRINGVSALISVALGDKADPGKQGNLYQSAVLKGAAIGGGPDVFAKGVQDDMSLQIGLDELGTQTISLGKKADLQLQGSNKKADGDLIAKKIQDEVNRVNPDQEPFKSFSCQLVPVGSDFQFVLTSGSSSADSLVKVFDGALAQLLKVDSSSKPASQPGAAKVIPKEITDALKNGTDGGTLIAEDYASFFDAKLAKVRDASIIVLPGVDAGMAGKGIVDVAIAHCEDMGNRMLIIDPPRDMEMSKDAFDSLGLSTSPYAALYYPWVKMSNPLYNPDDSSSPATVLAAPSAFVAGIWARIDGSRGVWKAPAGVETSVLGAAGIQFTVEDGDQDQLNPIGVNCLRKLPSYGAVVWGARTLATNSKPEWRYVPVRRTAILLKESIRDGVMSAVFEPNDHRLWSSLRANIDGFMNGLWRAGAFQGEKASEAYYVRCGLNDTMTQADIDAGQVIVIVGFAPVKPAEFVIVRIQQKVGQQ